MALSPTRLAFNPTTGQLDLVPQDPAQIVTVGKSGCMFTSIQAALDSITDAAANKWYMILVFPGVYDEDITLKAFVTIVGATNGTAAPTITGLVRGTFTNAGEHTLLNRINYVRKIATDGEKAFLVSGSVLLNDFFMDVWTDADYGFAGIEVDATTFSATLYSGRIQARNTYTGSTKDIIASKLCGNQDTAFANVQVEVNAKAASGTLTARIICSTGEHNGFSNNLRISNGVAFTGTAIGDQVTTASTKARIEVGTQIRLNGVSGGTAIACDLNSSGASAEMFYSGCVAFIDGFTNEYSARTALGDIHKVWLNSVNKNLGKTGAGLAVITPYDDVKSGFSEWSTTAGNTYSFTPTTGTFTNLKRFLGLVKSAPVSVAASQTLTGATALTDLAVNFVYADDKGVLKSTVSPNDALYENSIPVWEVWKDGSNGLVCRENHPYKFGTAVSQAWHNQFGSLLQSPSSTLSGLAAAKVGFTGENIIGDHGITSTVASTPAGITATFLYVDGAGKMRWYANTDTFPAFYNNAGTPTILTAGSNRWVIYRIGVIKDTGLTGIDTAQFVAVMDTVQHNSGAAATTRITSGLVTPFPPELKALEVCQVGYAVVRKQSGGAVDTTNVPPTTALQIFGAQYVSGGTSTAAGLITTNTALFDTILSGADTNVQLALDTIDNTAAKKASSSTDNALVRFDGTGGQLLQNSGVIVDDSNNVTGVNDLTVGGNLTVNGTQTILNVSDLEIEDNNILINRGEVGAGVTLGGAGIEVERGSLPNDSIAWIESTQDWMTGPNGGMRTLAKRDMSCCSNYIRRTEFNTASGSVPAGWSGTATITTTRTAADLPRENTTGTGINIVMTAGQIATFTFSLDDVDLNRVLQAVADVNVKSGTDILMTVKDGATVLGSVTLLSGFSSPRFDFVTASNAPLTLNFSSAAGGTVVVSDSKIQKLLPTIETRNDLFINGDFRIWQRGVSQTSSGLGSDDRWTNGHAAGSTKTHTRENFTVGQTDVPGEPRYFSRTVIATSSGTSTAVIKDQKVEDVRTLAGKFATLVFWAKADASKSMTVEFEQYFGTGGSPSAFVNFGATKLALTTAWKKYVIFVSVPSLSGKTLGTNEDHYFQVSMWLSAGSDFNSRTNSLGVQTGTFDIAKASLCEGICASTADVRPIAQELALCQRFYEKNDSNETGIWWSGNCTIGQTYYATAQYKVTKRATAPTIVKVGENADQFGTITISNNTINGFRCQSVASSTASAAYFRTGWTAESELS